jgi:hypothetical protein
VAMTLTVFAKPSANLTLKVLAKCQLESSLALQPSSS